MYELSIIIYIYISNQLITLYESIYDSTKQNISFPGASQVLRQMLQVANCKVLLAS